MKLVPPVVPADGTAGIPYPGTPRDRLGVFRHNRSVVWGCGFCSLFCGVYCIRVVAGKWIFLGCCPRGSGLPASLAPAAPPLEGISGSLRYSLVEYPGNRFHTPSAYPSLSLSSRTETYHPPTCEVGLLFVCPLWGWE